VAGWLLWHAVVAPYRASLLCCRGERQLVEHPDAALESLRLAATWDSGQDACWARLGGGAWQAAGVGDDRSEALLLEARAAFERACVLVPASPYHHNNRGRILAELARRGRCPIASAYEAFETAIALDAHNAAFYVDAANAALGVGDWATATAYARRVLADFPDFGPPLAQLGFVELEHGRPVEAEVLLRRALQQQQWPGHVPEMAVAFANLAAARWQQHDAQQTVLHAREALRRAPQMAQVRTLLAEAEHQLATPGQTGSGSR
jgi:tetratricopeptide (TPR) repeat protein